MDVKKFNELIKRIRTEEDAFNKIAKYYYPRAVHHVARIFHDYELAKDAAQEFFGIRLFLSNIPNYIESPLSWVFSSCKNAAIDIFKAKSGDQTLISISDFDNDAWATEFEKMDIGNNVVNEEVLATRNDSKDYFEVLSEAHVSETIIEKFRNLDKITVEIFIMHYWEDFSLKEITEVLKMNYDTVKSKFRRGKNYFKKISPQLHLFAYFFLSTM